MALLALLRQLQPQHGWRLQLWHGNHQWRPEATAQAEELAAWAASEGLPLQLEHWQRPAGEPPREASARAWRYGRLTALAQRLGCRRVVTGHTASDRAETVLLNLARGSHRQGLASLRRQRPLAGEVMLTRPLLAFSREDTAALCRELGLPVWIDSSNADPRYSRNRLRLEVLPVLHALHPGADQRIARLAEELEQLEDAGRELLTLALKGLECAPPAGGHGRALHRDALTALRPANQSQLLQLWLEQQSGRRWPCRTLAAALERLPRRLGPGRLDLGHGWRLQWQGPTLWLSRDGVTADP
jgi:tRNA(Ile)-lysidine synthase